MGKSASGVYQLFLDNMTTPCVSALYGTPLLPCKDPQNSRIYVGPSRTAVADVKFASATTTTTTYPNWDLSGDEDFVLRAKFKTQPEDKFGLIVRKDLGPDEQGTVVDSKHLWIHDGKLTFSIGGGGHLFGPVVNDGKWHEVALKSASGVYQLFLDNMTTPCVSALYGTPLLPCKDPQNSRIQVGPSRTAVADVKFATTTHE